MLEARRHCDWRALRSLRPPCREDAVPHLLLILEEGEDRRTRSEETGRDYYDSMVRFGEGLG